jgi:carbon-monoxide dehydrogenase medium subunit
VRAPAYTRPHTIDEALEVLESAGAEVTVLAGGQDVVPLMNQGRLHPSHIVDISRVRALASITANGMITVGPLVTHAQLAQQPLIRARIPLLAEAVGQIGGGVQVRNRGTIGGSVCASNPAYDLPVCLVAAEAGLIIQSPHGQHRVPASEFFLGAGRTTLGPGQLLVSIEVPAGLDGPGYAYEKLKFSEGGYGIASAACLVAMAEDGTCLDARVALGAVMETPIRLREVERILVGRSLADDVLSDAAAATSAAVRDPITDVMADGRYRRAMAAVVVRRALQRATRRARPERGGP